MQRLVKTFQQLLGERFPGKHFRPVPTRAHLSPGMSTVSGRPDGRRQSTVWQIMLTLPKRRGSGEVQEVVQN